jgi:hypothetical protein
MSAYFLVSALVLAALLFLPVSRLIWVLSVRRLQRKTGGELSEGEVAGQLTRARIVAALVCLLFAYLFNLSLLGGPAHG